ncbi:MAG: TraR/DksA family transcriptional regulator [Pyrinomonadaceae bacterium]
MKTFEERMKRKIEGEVTILNRWIGAIKHEHRADDLEVEGDNTPFNDNLDNTEIVEEQESRLELLERLIEKARKLDEALQRIPKGLYGICAACGKFIHKQRLEALPEADLCLTCQHQSEKVALGLPKRCPDCQKGGRQLQSEEAAGGTR